MENNKLKVKDLVNIGVFSAIYFIISMLVMALAMFSPVFWLAWPAMSGIICGSLYVLLSAKVTKKGVAFLMAGITGIIYFACGECTWVIVLTFIVAGLLAEVVRAVLGYKSTKAVVLSCGVLTLGFIGSPLPMWLFQDSYMNSIIEMGMSATYVNSMQSMISVGSLILMIIGALLGGMIGALIGKAIFKKHFAKAGII